MGGIRSLQNAAPESRAAGTSATIKLCAGRANGHRRAPPHGGDGRSTADRVESDHRLAIEGGWLTGMLGEEIEAQDHDPARVMASIRLSDSRGNIWFVSSASTV